MKLIKILIGIIIINLFVTNNIFATENSYRNTIRVNSILCQMDFDYTQSDSIKALVQIPLLFQNTKPNLIEQVESLKPFYKKLITTDDTIRILHLGDSNLISENYQNAVIQILSKNWGYEINSTKSRIQYDVLVTSGASMKDFFTKKNLTLISEKNPDLVIISFGTNECNTLEYNPQEHYEQLKTLYELLTRECPDAAYLFASPQGAYPNNKPNPMIAKCVSTLQQFAKDREVAFWNIYEIAGGNQALQNYTTFNLLRKDKIHFTNEGYKLQGELLGNAIINGMPKVSSMDNLLSKIYNLLIYNPSQPLFFNSGLFLFLFLLFYAGYALLAGNRQQAVRLLYLTIFSYYFYYKNAGEYCVLLAIITLGNYIIGRMIEGSQSQKKKKILVSIAVILMLSQLAYFKYTNFALSIILPWTKGSFEPLNIFLPAGISFFTFQSMNYVIDVYRGKLSACRNLIDFSFFVSFFPTLLAGPILRARNFLPQVRKPLTVTREMFGMGLWFIMIGLFKKAIISDYIGVNFVNRIFDDPSLYTGLENLLGIYGYALKLYCDFSGYSDMAIGIALWLGFNIPANFRSPHKSQSISEFWHRWHISLSSWLRDYLYISLGGNRKGKLRMYLNLFLTMLLGGLWHGASLNFIVWGSIHGFALCIHKWFREKINHTKDYRSTGFKKFAAIVLTFNLVCFCWLFFANTTFDASIMMLSKIFTEFHAETIGQFLVGYPIVSIMIVAGFILHFLPESWGTLVSNKIIKSPLWLQAIIFILLIILVVQVKSSDVQPFIYMQF